MRGAGTARPCEALRRRVRDNAPYLRRNLRAARVDLLEHRSGGGGSGSAGLHGPRPREADAEEQLLVFFVELENLKNSGARFLELFAHFWIAGGSSRNRA